MAHPAPRIERVPGVDNYLGETPVWCAAEQALYWINCEDPAELHRWRPDGGAHQVWPMPKRIGGVVLKEGGGVLVVLADGLYDFDLKSGALALRVASPLPAYVRLHETGCDRQGRFWVGAYDHNFTPTNRDARDGALLRLDGARLTPVVSGVSVSNGLAFSPDGRILYASDSPTRRIEAFDLDPATGALSNRRVFLDLPPGEGFVDGAAVDAEGGYWLATVGLGQLRRYRPDGELDRVIELPFSNPTKPAFGGPNLDVIYVTSTKLPMTLPGVAGAEQNGGLFAVHAGVRGLEDGLFRDASSKG
jgi:sugar lactone lactonase YvrE